MIYRHIGHITKDGKQVFDNPNLFNRHIKSLAGKRFEIVMKEECLPASGSQRAYYFAILKDAHRTDKFNHYDSPKELHDKLIAPRFLTEYYPAGEDIKERTKGLRDLNSESMSDLIERVKAFFTEEGIEIGESKNYYLK